MKLAIWLFGLSLFLANASAVHADVFGNVPEAADYAVAYELAIPLNGAFKGGTPVPYSVNNSATVAVGGYDRVAYYLELNNGAGTTWAYASMDAFNSSVPQLGLPHDTNNPVSFQRTVSNLTVYSNVAGVQTGSFDQGAVEMWHNGYNPGNANSVFGASNSAFDWGDTLDLSNPSGFGSFQIHNPGSKQVVIAYNRWAVADSSNDEVGIGSRPTGDPDWTFAANAGNYTARKLVILVRPKRFSVAFSVLPKSGQVTPRNLATNSAFVPVQGTESVGGYDKAVLRILRNGVQSGSDLEQPLAYSNGTASFAFNPQIPAELASYTFALYLQKSGVLYLARQVSDVVVGDVYVWYGQSNAEAQAYIGSADPGYASRWVRTFGMCSDSATLTQAYPFWSQAEGNGALEVAGGIGQWGLVVGRKIVDTYGIPVAVFNGARPAYSILQLQPDDTNPTRLDDASGVYRVYNRLRYRLNTAGVANSVRAIAYYQGENDTNNAQQHSDGFAGLVTAWQRDYPAVQNIFVSQLHVGCDPNVDRFQPALREVQRRLPETYANVRIMSSNGLVTNTDNCHFAFAGGYETHGLNVFRQVARDLYGAPDAPDIDPPNPLRIEQVNQSGDRLRIVLRNPNATLRIEPGALADFRLNNSTAVLLSGTITNAGIELQYDRSTADATGLDYLGHTGSAGDWIRNLNNIGLVAFSLPFASLSPAISGLSPAQSGEIAPGVSVTLAAAAATKTGTVVRLEAWVDGLLYAAVNNSGMLSARWTVPAGAAHKVFFRAINSNGYYTDKSLFTFNPAANSPGGIGTGLSVWLKPEKGISRDSAGRVVTWQDSSGNGNACTQSTDSAKPLFTDGYFGSLPGLSFDGNDFLNSPQGMPTGSYTKVVRAILSDVTLDGNLVSSAVDTTYAHAIFTAMTPYLRLFHGGTFVTASDPITLGQSFVLTAIYDSPTRIGKLFLNGKLVGSSTAGGDSTQISYQLGAFASSHFMQGAIGEVLIYNRVLSDSERSTVEGYFATKAALPPNAVPLGYNDWATANLPAGSNPAPTADANGNGISNLLEYALGLNPAETALPELLKVRVSGGAVNVSYLRPTNRTGITYRLFESFDLQQWTSVTDFGGPAANGREERDYSRALNPAGRAFYRLQVEIVP